MIHSERRQGRTHGKSLGLVEVTGLSSAVETADAMIKAANVELIGLEAARGSGMMTVKVIGDVGAVKAAVEAGKACAMTFGALVSFDVIARPIESTGDMFVRTAGDTASPMFIILSHRPRHRVQRQTQRAWTTNCP